MARRRRSWTRSTCDRGGRRPARRCPAVEGLSVSASVERLPQSCPLGQCDGSGWLIDEEDVASPCDCRGRRIAQARLRGVRATLPEKYAGVSFDRPPISDMARAPQSRAVVEAVREFTADLGGNLAAGRGIWFIGDVGTGRTSRAMLVSKLAIEAGHSAAVYSLPRLLTRIRRTY